MEAPELTDLTAQTNISTFHYKNKDVEVYFDSKSVRWNRKGGKKHDIPVTDILSAEAKHSAKAKSPTLVLRYVQRKTEKCLLKSVAAAFQHRDTGHCQEWAQNINDTVATACDGRPKSLLVFINPVSGKASAPKVFEKKARPHFEHAGIKLDVVLTEDADHANRTVEAYDLDSIDGVLAVGGDGTLLQVTNALLLRTMKDAGRDANDPTSEIVVPKIPVGVLSAGTGNGMASMTNGTDNVESLALNIILGETFHGLCMTVHNGGKLTSYANFQAAYGLFGDMMKTSESNRDRFGRSRYVYGMMKHLTPRVYDAEVEIPTEEGDWRRVPARGIAINCLVWGQPNQNYSGNMYNNLQKLWGTEDMCTTIVSETAGITGFFRHLYRVIQMKSNAYDLDYIDHYQGNQARMIIPGFADSQFSRVLNIDGEPVDLVDPTVEIRMHKRSVKFFGTKRQSEGDG